METRFAVQFVVNRTGWPTKIRNSTVSLRSGYSDFADIPKILTIPLGISVDEIEIIAVLNLKGL